MKRGIALLLSAVLVLTLAGCGMSQSNTDKDRIVVLKLAVREGTYATVVKHSLEKFEEEHNVKCDILELTEEDLRQEILTSKDNSNSVDLCMVDGSWVPEFTEKNVLLNLSDAGYSLDGDIIPATTDISYQKGDIYVAPFFGNVTVLLFNKELLATAGYQKENLESLDDILSVCKKSQENGQMGFLYRGDTNNNLVVDFLPILLSFGGWVVDENNNPTVNTEEFQSAMKYYIELTNTGKATTKDDIINAITAGHGAMTIGWPGWYTPKEDSTAEYCSIKGRVNKTAEVYNANIYGIWGLGVSADSQNKELSVELLKYLMDPEVQKESVDVGGVPCRYSCLNDREVLEKYPEYEDVCVALETGKYRPMISNWNEFMDILGPHISGILSGEESIDGGLNDAQSELEELMGK